MKRRIYLGADHKGFELKNYIKEKLNSSFQIEDCGAFSFNPDDNYPDFAKKVVEKVVQNKNSFGILICGTGIGMTICANKHPKIRAALCLNSEMAEISRRHNNANILCFPASLSKKKSLKIIQTFLSSNFERGRHQRRINKIKGYAKEFQN